MFLFSWIISVYKIGFSIFTYVFSMIHSQAFNRQKQELFSCLQPLASNRRDSLKIVEIGAGTGINLQYYPENSHIICLDPNPYMFKFIKPNPDSLLQVEHLVGYAENMQKIADNSVDVVVSTLVLCSVSDLDKSLAEVKRILKPGGIYLYLEHVIYDSNSVWRQIQTLINPLWRCILDGCNLTIEIAKHMDNAGFSQVTQKHFCIPYRGLLDFIAAFPLMRRHLIGCAKK